MLHIYKKNSVRMEEKMANLKSDDKTIIKKVVPKMGFFESMFKTIGLLIVLAWKLICLGFLVLWVCFKGLLRLLIWVPIKFLKKLVTGIFAYCCEGLRYLNMGVDIANKTTRDCDKPIDFSKAKKAIMKM